jgi:dUTP pyrophosphatase
MDESEQNQLNESEQNQLNELESLKGLLDDLTKTLEGTIDTSQPVDNPVETYQKLVDNYDGIKNNFSVVTKFTNNSNNPDPEYSKVGDSGFDLRANIKTPITLKSLERKLVPTGLKFELSPNTELQVRPRSGMALKHGISVVNTPGTVDEGYRGEVGVIVINLSKTSYIINPGDRIAQGVIMNVIGQNISKLVKTNNLNETERGDGGFGSTGKQ